MTTLNLEVLPGRCPIGYDLATQHPHLCDCLDTAEWEGFLAALKAARDDHGVISQTNVRPLIQGIPHKHRGQLYRRATSLGVIESIGYEPSTDAAGGNTDKPQRRYLWKGQAAA